MQARKMLVVSIATALLALSGSAGAVQVKLGPHVSKINTPLAMVQPAGDDRQFIVEQFGLIKILHPNGQLQGDPFLDVRNHIPQLWKDFDERGLLGLAFHPDYAKNGKFYIAYSGHLDFQGDLGKEFWWDHTNTVAEYTVSADDPNRADANSGRVITAIDWPQFNHNGHWIGFGPDGYLYISSGDGGYANDWGIGHNVTEGNGQDLSVLNGKILRIDVNGYDAGSYSIPADNPFVGKDGVAPEIYAFGLRNPWRCSFDTGSGALFCGDVQQNSYEEISVIEKGGNYGWRRMEANHCFDYQKPDDHPTWCDVGGLATPILEYNNCTAQPDGCKGVSVTGGYVYRGAHEAWDGKYIFGDWSKGFAEMDGQIFMGTKGADGKWSMEIAEVTNLAELKGLGQTQTGKLPYVLAFAQDNAGEVYVLTSITTGPVGTLDTIYKIVPAD